MYAQFVTCMYIYIWQKPSDSDPNHTSSTLTIWQKSSWPICKVRDSNAYIHISKELPDSDSDHTSLALTTCMAIEFVTHIQSLWLEYIHTHITGATWQWFRRMSSAPTTIVATEFLSQMQSSWLESIHTHITGATWQWFRLMSSAPTTITASRYIWATNCCVCKTQSSQTKYIWMIIKRHSDYWSSGRTVIQALRYIWVKNWV